MSLYRLVEWMSVLGAVCGTGYYLLCIWAAWRFPRNRANVTTLATPVSILKPLRGADPEMYEAFRSHCLLDYPEYELIFGVSDARDPAIALVERLQKEFPQRSIRLTVCERILGTNVKVSNLIQMLLLAHYEHMIVNDSDIRVPADYLVRVMQPFADPTVGLVTCPYRGAPGKTLGSHLESLGISTEFIPGVFTARVIENGVHFALGSTLAFHRKSLAAIGGFEPVLDYLADDFELGARMAAAGYRVELADVVVDTHVPDYTFAAFFNHQLRWGRSTRNSRPIGYTGLLLTFGFAWSLVFLLLTGGSRQAWTLVAATLAVRLAMAISVGWGVLRDRHLLRQLWLLPLRDLVGVLVWIGSYTGRRVTWRGQDFILEGRKLKAVVSSE